VITLFANTQNILPTAATLLKCPGGRLVLIQLQLLLSTP